MSIDIRYNSNGTITVECGNETVTIVPQGTALSDIKTRRGETPA